MNASGVTNIWTFPLELVGSGIMLLLLMRVGLVAAIFSGFVNMLFINFPITHDTSAWYSEVGFAALAILAVIVLYAFRTSLARRPLLAPSRLDG